MILLIATAVLLLVGAVPVYAAPGGVPGPPAGHGKVDHGAVTTDTTVLDVGTDATGVPDWAKAYGKRIQEEYDMTYGHLQQCARMADGSGDEVTDSTETPLTAPDTCPTDLQFPDGVHGAMAFWVATHSLIIST